MSPNESAMPTTSLPPPVVQTFFCMHSWSFVCCAGVRPAAATLSVRTIIGSRDDSGTSVKNAFLIVVFSWSAVTFSPGRLDVLAFAFPLAADVLLLLLLLLPQAAR